MNWVVLKSVVSMEAIYARATVHSAHGRSTDTGPFPASGIAQGDNSH